MTNPIEFTLYWSRCTQAVERPEQLQHMQIEIQVAYKLGNQNEWRVDLKDYSIDFYRKVFGWGKARLVGDEKGSPKIEPEDPTAAIPSHLQQHVGASSSIHSHANRPQQHASASSSAHGHALKLIPKSEKELSLKPGPLTVTVDPKYISLSNVNSFNAFLVQASEDGEFMDCDNPLVSMTNPIEFTLYWSRCTQAIEHPEQLQHMQIEIQVAYKLGNQNEWRIDLKDYSTEFYRQVFGGGKAKLVGDEKGSPKIEPVDPIGTPSASSQSHPHQYASASSSTHSLPAAISSHPQQHASALSFTHSHANHPKQHVGAPSHTHSHAHQLIPKSEKELSVKPSPLTVTVDPQYISNVNSFNVNMKQAKENDEFNRKDCANPTVTSLNPIEFTLDWSKCPRAVERPEQLRHMDIQIEVLHKGGGKQHEAIWLNHYSAGFHRRIFGGGKARLVKFLKTTFGKREEFPKLEYLEDPTGTHIPPAGTLTFNVEYQHRTVSSIRRVAVSHPSIKVEMDECQPENMGMGGKFALDLAKCNVHDLGDLLDLQMVLRVALQKGQHPNRVEGRTERFEFGMLSNTPENVLRHAHQMNILLSEKYKPMITLNGSSAHSHARQLVSKSQKELTAQEASAGYYQGRKNPSNIAFFLPRKILEGVRDIHLLNNEPHKMRLWNADGDKCPVEIAGDFDGSVSAVLQIDWTKCTPNQPKSYEELEGMELVVYYQLDQDEPKQIRHTFKQDEPLQVVFRGTIVGRLEVFEDGSVKFEQNH